MIARLSRPCAKLKKKKILSLVIVEQVVGECVGGALGPDWLGGVELHSGATDRADLLKRRVQLETQVEVTALLTPQEYAALEEGWCR